MCYAKLEYYKCIKYILYQDFYRIHISRNKVSCIFYRSKDVIGVWFRKLVFRCKTM